MPVSPLCWNCTPCIKDSKQAAVVWKCHTIVIRKKFWEGSKMAVGHRRRLHELRESGTWLRPGDTLGWGKAPGELKRPHPEPLTPGRLLHSTIQWKNKSAPTPTLSAGTQAPQNSQAAHQPTGSPVCSPPTGLLAHWLPPATAGLHHHQTPDPSLPVSRRQTGLDAKGVTPELPRLKFYCSWTRDFFFSFFSFL
jgi:hypothetical protein